MAVQTDERIRLFRQECRNYVFYCSRIEDLNRQLEVLNTKIDNLHSVSTDSIRGQAEYSERPLISMIEKRDELLNSIRYYRERIDWIVSVTDAVPSFVYRYVIWKTFVMRGSLNEIADTYEVSVSKINQNRKKYLTMVLTDEKMAEYDRITAAEG